MKTFALSLILFLLMLGAIVFNFLYINRTADAVLEMLDALPDIGDPSCADAARKISDYWEARVDTAGLSVSYTILDRVSEQATTAVACAESGDFYGFRVAVALLRDAIGDFRRLEAFSVGNLM